jgi:hypothetical protein
LTKQTTETQKERVNGEIEKIETNKRAKGKKTKLGKKIKEGWEKEGRLGE